MAVAHLSVLEDLGGYTPANIARGMLVFTPPALLLGIAFWKHGIETAVIAHASALIFGWLFLSTTAGLAQAGHGGRGNRSGVAYVSAEHGDSPKDGPATSVDSSDASGGPVMDDLDRSA